MPGTILFVLPSAHHFGRSPQKDQAALLLLPWKSLLSTQFGNERQQFNLLNRRTILETMMVHTSFKQGIMNPLNCCRIFQPRYVCMFLVWWGSISNCRGKIVEQFINFTQQGMAKRIITRVTRERELPFRITSACTILYQWLFLVPVKGGRWHIIPQLAVYTTLRLI